MVSHSRAQPSARRLLASASISAVPMPAWAGETLAVLSDQRRQCSGVDKFAVYRHCGGTPPLAQEATDPLGVCRLGLADNGALLGHGCGVSRCRAVERRPDGLIAISLGSLPYPTIEHMLVVITAHPRHTVAGIAALAQTRVPHPRRSIVSSLIVSRAITKSSTRPLRALTPAKRKLPDRHLSDG